VSQPQPYNPLDVENLGKSVAQALLDSPKLPLAKVERFEGPGLYAIYYNGSFEPYAVIAKKGDWPIYVGKAVPAGRRKGKTTAGKDYSLSSRVAEHAESIRATKNLDIADFSYQALVVNPLFIPLGEALLITRFAPIWNRHLDGFGNHDPGAGRYEGLVPRWDVVHPGRSWATKLKSREETPEQILSEIAAYLAGSTVPNPQKKIEINIDDLLAGDDEGAGK
jgi:hypothetical protein